MSGANKQELSLPEAVSRRIAELHTIAPDSIGDQMGFQVVKSESGEDACTLRCRTFPWMRNAAGTLHGGMCATVLDQAMGFLAYCIKPGPGQAPTVQLQVTYHRPLIPGEDVIVRVKVISVTKSLMHLSAEAALADSPERVCLTGSAIYFYKHAE